jgi:hypothetical protein
MGWAWSPPPNFYSNSARLDVERKSDPLSLGRGSRPVHYCVFVSPWPLATLCVTRARINLCRSRFYRRSARELFVLVSRLPRCRSLKSSRGVPYRLAWSKTRSNHFHCGTICNTIYVRMVLQYVTFDSNHTYFVTIYENKNRGTIIASFRPRKTSRRPNKNRICAHGVCVQHPLV